MITLTLGRDKRVHMNPASDAARPAGNGMRDLLRDAALLVTTLASGGTVQNAALFRERCNRLVEQFEDALIERQYPEDVKREALVALCGLLDEMALRQPATPWALHGVGWIDCGPSCGPGHPWDSDVQMQTRVTRAPAAASPMPWPLPQPLIRAMPRRFWRSPRVTAFVHALVLLGCAAAVAFLLSLRHNQTLLTRIAADLRRYSMIPAVHDTAKRDALQTLVADRNELQRYARTGTPLPLSFGLYRGAALIPPLNDAIASYQPPPPPPAVVTLDSMSLFDSGKARLKDGSTRVMINALEMIRTHPGKRILVAGHTDNVGNRDSNLKLSTARAEAVRDWLIEASGIPATQFAIQGYGDTRPVADNTTGAGRAKNRRVEITLVPDAAQQVPLGDETQPARTGDAQGRSPGE